VGEEPGGLEAVRAPAPLSGGGGDTGGSGTRDWSHPVYFAKASDPAYRIHLSAMANPDIEGHLIHVPAGARPAGAGAIARSASSIPMACRGKR
jgi:hypothetical protein